MSKGERLDPFPSALAFSVPAPAPDADAGPTSLAVPPKPLFAERYELVSLLGAGGMATVYLARDRELDDDIALKVLRPDVAAASLALDLFKREVKLARRVTHPNVARVYDIGESRGTRFLTMEYVDGPSLATMMEKPCTIPVSEIVRIASELCAGLGAAHKASVIHRDLKPENVLLDSTGRVVITDFGVARAMQLGGVTMTNGRPIGTPAYMPPEQIAGVVDPDGRVDIYGLGALLYEMLTGLLPYSGGSALAVTSAQLSQKPSPPHAVRVGVSPSLSALVMRCLELDRDKRYATIIEVGAALAAVAAESPPSAVRGPVAEGDRGEDSRRRQGGQGARAEARPSVLPSAAKAIAVLAFRHADTEEDALLADGLWGELISSLSTTNGLRVRARSPLASLRNVEPRVLGERMGADVVVSGSVRRTPAGIRVTVKLVSVVDGFLLWAQQFEGSPSDLFPLVDSIATGVARALSLSRTAPPRQSANDAMAMDLYLRARREHRKASFGDPKHAFELFEQALRRAPEDPTLLAAYALVTVRAWYYGEEGAENAAVRARWSAKKAVEIAPHLADARHAFALCLLHDGDAAQAVAELRLITDSVDFAAAHETLAGILQEIGLVSDARRHLELALANEPSSFEAIQELARLEALAGNWAAAEERLAQLAAIDAAEAAEAAVAPGSRRAARLPEARLALWRRDTQRAASLLRGEGPAGPIPAAILDALHGTLDPKRIRATFDLATSTEGSQRRRALLHQLSCEIACALDRADWAFDALSAATASHLIDLVWLTRCPALEKLRGAAPYHECERTLVDRAAQIALVYKR